MRPAGRRAFEARSEARSAIYAYERPRAVLGEADEAAFRATMVAWDWFGRAAPSYQKTAIHWVVSARQPQTQARRLAALIADSAAGHAVQPLTRPTNTREDA